MFYNKHQQNKTNPPGQADASMKRGTCYKCDELSLNPRIHMERENRLLQSCDVLLHTCVQTAENTFKKMAQGVVTCHQA